MVTTPEEFRATWRESLSNWFALLIILYNALCQCLLEAWVCIKMPDGSHVLRVDPDQTCYTSDHTAMRVFSAVGILAYVIGIPVGLMYMLYRLRQSNKLKDPDSLQLFGFLYEEYEPGFWYWQGLVCARRFWLIMLYTLLYSVPQFQLAVGLVVVIVLICIQVFPVAKAKSVTTHTDSHTIARSLTPG